MAERRMPVFPMPRTAFVLLLLSVIFSVLPHWQRVPSWLLAVFVLVLGWRILVFRQRLQFPARWLRLLLVSAGFVGVIYHHGTIFGPEAGVGLLITAYLFKQLEMYTRRDALLVVILSFFVLATAFLFSKSLYITLYILLVMVLITAALVALNQTDRSINLWSPLRAALSSMAQAVPLMLVLFFLFPRIGPIWELGMQTSTKRTGLSEQMSPADIAELSQSSELALRIEFEDEIPLPRDRYWRATVFDRFDGRTWYAQDAAQVPALNRAELSLAGKPLRYRVYLEPTGQHWLLAAPLADVQGLEHRITSSLIYHTEEAIDSSVSYRVESFPDYQYQQAGISRLQYTRNTALPAGGNQRTRRYSRQLLQQSNGDPAAMVQAIHSWFFTSPFVYTLKPPQLGANTIDEFLFDTRRGFCAHYAGALVFMLRSVGIPARMVAGYQGGEPHPIGRYLLVHQYDAHAWVEYWQPGAGWVRADPTAAVAPHRIESGSLRESLQQQELEDSPFSALSARNLPGMERLRLLVDYMDYLWLKNVVTYNRDSQYRFLRNLMGEVTPQRIALALAVCGGLVVLGIALVTWLP